MSGYHRISKLKSCVNSLKHCKSLNKLNETLGREIDVLCSKAKLAHDSAGNLGKIKELNQLLTKEFNKATTNIKTETNVVLNLANENVRNCGNKLKEVCKPLYSLSGVVEEKRAQYKQRYLKSKHIRKEAEKLCHQLTNRHVYGSTFAWSAAGLSLREDKANIATDAASKADLTLTTSVLDKEFPSQISEAVAQKTLSKPATVLDINSDYFVVKTGKYAEDGDTVLPQNGQNSFTKLSHGELEAEDGDAVLPQNGHNSFTKLSHGELEAQNVHTALAESTSTEKAEEVDTVLAESTSTATVIDLTHEKDNVEIAGSTETVLDPIPEPPPVPDVPGEALNQLNALGEQTFASLGLGGWSPVGIVQNCMEFLHVDLGMQWWAAIVLGTIVIRICLFPLVILAQRNAAKMNNYLPQMQIIQMKLTEARQTGDALNAARYSQELMVFMKEKGLNPLKNMVVPLAQAPIFVSFFMGLRQMANVPVDSLRNGGLFWFEDLTLPDQYFLLPVVTSFTLWLTVELGTDSAKLSSQNMVVMKYVLRAIPVMILPFTVNFPGAILCYWVSSNFISLAQVAFLRIPSVRDYFKIERMITFKPEQLPNKPKGFKEGIKDSWTNLKITRELEERRRLDEMQFRRAGKGPVQKTYKYDPTKQSTPGSQTPMSAKKRE